MRWIWCGHAICHWLISAFRLLYKMEDNMKPLTILRMLLQFHLPNRSIYILELCEKSTIVDCVPRAAWWRLWRVRSVPTIHTSHIATMSLEVHTTLCVQIGGKSRVACECAVSRGQSSFGRYEHFHPLKRAVWTFRPILTPRHNWLHAALRTSMQCDFFRPFGHKIN